MARGSRHMGPSTATVIPAPDPEPDQVEFR